MGAAASSSPREVTVGSDKADYKVAASEYKAYLLSFEDTPKSLPSSLRHSRDTSDTKWEAERRVALAKERRSMLTQMRRDPLQRPIRVVTLRPSDGTPVRTVTVRPRGVVLESA